MPIHKQLLRHATERPDKPALLIDGRSRSYGELNGRAKALYRFLRQLPGSNRRRLDLPGVDKLAALSLGNHIGFAEYFLAATASPNACAVIDPMMPPERIERIIERLAPDVLVVDDDASPSAAIGRRLGVPVITAGAEPFDLTETEGDLPDDAEGIFLIGFTSGTTAEPKAYYRSREQWRRSLDRGRAVFELEDAPSTMCPGALAHGLALYALVEALDAGGTFHSVRKWDPAAVARILSAEEIERLVAVPTHIAGISRASAAEPALTALRDVLTAGAKLDVNGVESMRRLFPNARIREYYGASEIGFMTVSTLVGGARDFPIDRVGQAYPGVEISIRDPDGNDVGTDVPGTIFVRSDLIADGYLWGDDGQAFRVSEAGATVGDLGELDENGMLRVIGRAGGMMISGGNNVYPAEVESALKACPGVEDAVVFGLPDAYYGQRIVAVVSGDASDTKMLADHCARQLARFKIPRQFYHIASWPMTSSGKISRGQVEAAVISGDGLVLRLSA
ncbi:acyl-CoA synthetase (AMP-forming)/AMP-acid ligase II [Rhizobium leguminosarum bv. trifolii WSM2297]|uniref:Acyl-CoA synthetase (AMP-forming)/AMP-acid ligase II n=1 Tax=Rhizobium leguminosarum bv. trifolii WSM2297 TaxID=754762 RepID=J0L2Y8_RHILT|nr:AMP-binding protein [Rhizobium leguminosarum]EJC83840.1 acyl-CoA synthetase (AMP-forming)/AMP-acid ligase II [Rhizobium leguminosarum bv. trifolii WSM2297]EJC84569.1 acyl-CoA synthetase (AMP-forming)/AMP-acid ligase II [Rhizobium leguminosarum bv. trifolii WSM2297]